MRAVECEWCGRWRIATNAHKRRFCSTNCGKAHWHKYGGVAVCPDGKQTSASFEIQDRLDALCDEAEIIIDGAGFSGRMTLWKIGERRAWIQGRIPPAEWLRLQVLWQQIDTISKQPRTYGPKEETNAAA